MSKGMGGDMIDYTLKNSHPEYDSIKLSGSASAEADLLCQDCE